MKMSEPYPLRFIPHYEQRLWGGEKFKTHLNKDIQGNQYGESWEISVLKGKASVVQNGTLKGTSLPQLIAENPKVYSQGNSKSTVISPKKKTNIVSLMDLLSLLLTLS